MKKTLLVIAVSLAILSVAASSYFASLYVKNAINNSGTLTQTGVSTFTGIATFSAAPVIKYAPVYSLTDSSLTITSTYYGKIVSTSYANTQYITLPTPSSSTVGVQFWINNAVDQTLWIKGAAVDQIIADGVLASDNVSFATASHKIGAMVHVVGISATKWLITCESVGTTMTVAS